MPRHALKAFFERLIVASLPLTMAACGSHGHGETMAPPDLSVAVSMDMAASDPSTNVYPPDPCESFPTISVPIPDGYEPDGGLVQQCRADQVCLDLCPPGYTLCCGPVPSADADAGAAPTMACAVFCPTGRRPAGMQAESSDGVDPVGAWLAGMAQLEAASIHAFAVLADELRAHAAPRALVAAARRARGDEIRHARVTARLARVRGCTPARVTVTAFAPRPLEALAVENAVEGCVRETFGALLASWQAHTAGAADIRAAMQEIAVDETRHAELAWAVDAWARRRLDRAARRRVTEARRAAAAALANEVVEPTTALAQAAGLPSVAQSQALLAGVARTLWS